MSKTWRHEAFIENSKMVYDFAEKHKLKVERFNSGYQIRLGGVIDIYPVRKKWHYLIDGTRGEFDDISELDLTIFHEKNSGRIEPDYRVSNHDGRMTYPSTDGTITLRQAVLSTIELPIPEGEVVVRIETWREDDRREYFWQFWKPKYGTQHVIALTERGAYDITSVVNKALDTSAKK